MSYPKRFRVRLDYCKGKPSYDKKGALTAKNKRWIDDRIRLRVYHCPDCNLWHLTSLLKPRKY